MKNQLKIWKISEIFLGFAPGPNKGLCSWTHSEGCKHPYNPLRELRPSHYPLFPPRTKIQEPLKTFDTAFQTFLYCAFEIFTAIPYIFKAQSDKGFECAS